MRRICVIDLEATGLKPETDQTIEICMVSVDLTIDKGKCITKNPSVYLQKILPTCAIHADAYAVHKIAMSDLISSPKFIEVAPDILKRINEADVLIAHNMGYDGPMLAADFYANKISMPDKPVFCTKEEGRWATYNGKYPKLSELAFALGYDYDEAKAHSAKYDTLLTLKCLVKGLDKGFFKFPDELTAEPVGEIENCYSDPK